MGNLKVKIAGSGAGPTGIPGSPLVLYSYGNLSLRFFKMRLIITEISSKMVRVTCNNVHHVLSAGLTRKQSIIVSSEHKVGGSQREMDGRAPLSCLKDTGTES